MFSKTLFLIFLDITITDLLISDIITHCTRDLYSSWLRSRLQLILEISATYRLVSYLLRAMHDSAQLITLTSTLIIPDITKTESNNCLIIRKSKALKFNRRPSKLEKINRQPSKQTPIETLF